MRSSPASPRRTRVARLSLPFALVLAALPAVAQRSIGGESARVEAAQRRLSSAAGGSWRARIDEESGFVRLLRGGSDSPRPGSPAEAARAFLLEHAPAFGLDRAHLSLLERRSTPVKRHVRVELQQLHRELEVHRATLVLLVDELGRVAHVTSGIRPIGDIDVVPAFAADELAPAIEAALGGTRAELLRAVDLVVLAEGAGRLAYRAVARAQAGGPAHELLLDARDGALIGDTPLVLDDERAWLSHGPPAGVRITEIGLPADPFEVRIELGGGSEGANEDGLQRAAVFAAGIELLPCTEYRFRLTSALTTWDSHNAGDTCGEGYRDVFVVNVNSDDLLWQMLSGQPVGELFCDALLRRGGGELPGTTWAFGGDCAGDGSSCVHDASWEMSFHEPSSARTPSFALALDTSGGDERFPSWGLFEVEILAPTLVFSPNATLGDPAAHDAGDRDGGVACSAYETVALDGFQRQPGADGYWRLWGEHVRVRDELELPHLPAARSRTSDFPFTRSCPEFEAVMCYHHLARSMRYVESLGYALRNKPLRVDPHGLDGADNSHYTPDASCAECAGPFGCGSIAFGEGGVDDAEDADVILHEYGHALQDDMTCGIYFGHGTRGYGNETGAMGEGFGDYWACSHFADEVADPAAMGEWDAQDPLGLRRVDGTKQYPFEMEAEVHADGEIWSAVLWRIFGQCGKAVADELVLTSHLLVSQSPTFLDGVLALLDADALAGGANRAAILAAVEAHGIVRQLDVLAVRGAGGHAAPLAGVPVHALPADVLDVSDGATPVALHHAHAQLVTLTAPAQHGKLAFRQWVIDGYAWPVGLTTTKTYVGATEERHVAVAVYE